MSQETRQHCNEVALPFQTTVIIEKNVTFLEHTLIKSDKNLSSEWKYKETQTKKKLKEQASLIITLSVKIISDNFSSTLNPKFCSHIMENHKPALENSQSKIPMHCEISNWSYQWH